MLASDYRPISDTAYDTANCEKTTIGAFTIETLDMQAETLTMICNIVSAMWGDKHPATPIKPSENLMSRLAAIQENQRAIMTAVRAIVERL